MRALRWLCAGVAVLTPACGRSDDKAFVGYGAPRYEDPTPHAQVAFTLLGSIGTAEGPMALSNIPAVAVGTGGTVAVLDRFNCQVVLLDSLRNFIKRIGRCGSGPGEMLVPWRIAFHADSIVLFDSQQAAFLVWDLQGKELRRFQLTELRGARGVRDVAIVDDSTLLVAKDLNATVYTDHNHLVSVLDLETGRVRSDAVPDVPISLSSRRVQSRPVYLCAPTERTAPNMQVVVSNVWQPEVVTFSRFPDEVAAHVVTLVDWLPVRYDENGPDAPGIPTAEISVACGRDAFVQMYRVFDYTQRPPTLREGMLEVRRYDGTLLHRTIWSESHDSVFMGTPRAAHGNMFYFVDNAVVEGYPRVIVYNLTTLEGSDESRQ